MPEVLGNPPSPRTVLFWNGTVWQWALVDAAGHLQIDVLTSGLPVGAATAANQALILAQLQLIEDMRDALESVATDRYIVRGENQLFSIKDVFAIERSAVISGANGYIDSPAISAGDYKVITTICASDSTTAVTKIVVINRHDGANISISEEARAFAIGDRHCWSGHTYLDVDDVIRVYFFGGLVGDDCEIEVTGYTMTLET